MSNINITNIKIMNNPAPFQSPLSFQITFECLKDLPEEVEWKLIYIGSSTDEKFDQILDCFTMGPLQYGIMEFELESNPPDHTKIPQLELLGVTAIILSVSYKEQEFFRVGYYVYNTYTEQELIDNPPEEVQIDKVVRNILAEKPRITRFDIKWGDEKEDEILASTEAQSIDLNANENSNHAQMFFNGDPNNLQENQKGNPFLMTEEKQIDNFQQNVFGSNDNVKDNIGIHVEDPSKFRGFF